MIRWWTESLKQRLFASSKDGYLVFYPHGPFKGYVVSDPSYQRVIVAWISGFTVFTLVTGIVAIAIGVAIGFAGATLSAIGLFNGVWYAILVGRLAKGLTALPFGIGFRVYAHCSDEEKLWKQLFAGVFGVAMGTWMLLIPIGPLMPAVLWTAMAGLMAVTAAALLHVRRSGLKSCSSSPGVPDAADID